jgi:hypothetical protein
MGVGAVEVEGCAEDWGYGWSFRNCIESMSGFGEAELLFEVLFCFSECFCAVFGRIF